MAETGRSSHAEGAVGGSTLGEPGGYGNDRWSGDTAHRRECDCPSLDWKGRSRGPFALSTNRL